MKVIIKANAHYTNGHTEHFSNSFDVTDEEFAIIKKCAEDNNGKIEKLKGDYKELYNRFRSFFKNIAEGRGHTAGSYRPIRMLGGGGPVYRRKSLELLNIILYYKEH